MASTYDPIATTTLGSAASSITFSSISSAYTDLRVVMVASITGGSDDLKLQFNSDTGTNYSDTILKGNGTSATSRSNTSGTFAYLDWDGALSTTWSMYTTDVFSYAGSTYKTILSTSSADKNGSGGLDRIVSLWRSTSAINTIKLFSGTNFATGTTATLYGILKA